MKFLNFLLFPFKLIFYILHILYLDFRVSFDIGLLPIFEMFDLYKEYWNETKNIDSWYKKSIDYLIELINTKSRIDY